MVSITLVRELGPVLTALMVAGRNASGMASELGSMKVTEQIDAMRALGTDPVQKLVTPRLIATGVMLPLLTIIADFVGMFGGLVIARFFLNLTSRQYWTSVWRALEWNDVTQGLLKPLVFAVVISLVGCFYGLRTTGGTQGVGRSTTQAVVAGHRAGLRSGPSSSPRSSSARARHNMDARETAPQPHPYSASKTSPSPSTGTWRCATSLSTALEGESRVILGAAGSGKTVLLKTALGLVQAGIRPGPRLRPGHHRDDVSAQLFDIRSKIGMLFQESALFDSLTIEENVAYPLLNQPSDAVPAGRGAAARRGGAASSWSWPERWRSSRASFPAACGAAPPSPAPW